MTEPSLDLLARSARAVSGEAANAAFAELARVAGPIAWRIARRVLGNETGAADAMQESLVKLARSLDRWDARRAFLPWFSRLALRSALDEARWWGRRAALPLADVPEPEAPCDERPDRAWEDAQLHQRVAAWADELAPRQRAVFALRDLEGWDVQDIAAELEMAPSTVRVHLARARAHIRRRWQTAAEEDADERRPADV